MNRVWWYLRGYWIVELTGASPDWALNRLTEKRIPFWNVQWLDEFTIRISIFPRDLKAAEKTAEQSMCQLQTSTEMGFRQLIRGIFYRPVLWASLLVGVLTAVLVPKFVLFYEVNGNETVPDEVILRALEELEIGFGIYGPNIRSQWVEDHMLNLVDGLQWVTVNQSGCRAVVEVRERPETPEVLDRRGFSNIVASRAGIITGQSIWTGQPLKEIGDTVIEGELLVSGVVDLERTFLLTRAQAEIYARTWRNFQVVTPLICSEKGDIGESWNCVWLEIGKRRIKIFGNSGISYGACDKMINRKMLSLPGGSELPVSLLIETFTERENAESQVDLNLVQLWLSVAVEETVLADMKAGEILRREQKVSADNGVCQIDATLECREMIAETVEANWIEEDFEDD